MKESSKMGSKMTKPVFENNQPGGRWTKGRETGNKEMAKIMDVSPEQCQRQGGRYAKSVELCITQDSYVLKTETFKFDEIRTRLSWNTYLRRLGQVQLWLEPRGSFPLSFNNPEYWISFLK